MTHAEALEGNAAGIPASTCPGELARRGKFTDYVFAPDRPPRARGVEDYFCRGCGQVISMVDERVLNAYARPPRPTDPKDLAAALDARGTGVPGVALRRGGLTA